MRKLIFFNIILLISLLCIGCKEKEAEGPLAQYNKNQQSIIKLRMDYEIALENWIKKSDANEIIMNLRIKNNSQKGTLNYLTLKLVQYDLEGNTLSENYLSVDVSTIGKGESKTLLLKYPHAVEGVEGVSVEIEPYPPKEHLEEHIEFS